MFNEIKKLREKEGKKGRSRGNIKNYLKSSIWYASLAECCDNIYAEEWHPAYEKNTHDNTDSDSCLVIGYVIGSRWLRFCLRLWRLVASTLGTEALRQRGVR